ncbi:DUF1259 domain-containing protein [Bacillus sp. T33-2]|uniref:DUF1259 domain-containing protein n=1 Tax=Bacillus sp. T33-2 TaxID=2054168 RepID=UPI000C78C942|nr:DUF1259 domain-containing protein [Bacillus sp. T33-2]PLR92565.1 hypothetical protein CVD19_20110 [Bacillus sp. T33-2]
MKKIMIIGILIVGFAFPPKGTLANQETNCKVLEQIFATDVEAENGVCKLEITRENLHVTHMGKKLSPETMELVFHISFENVDGQTAVIGEMALLENEINPVIDEFRKGNIDVSAIHNHMIHEQPRIMYLHFQGTGDLTQQAHTIKNAIGKTRLN